MVPVREGGAAYNSTFPFLLYPIFPFLSSSLGFLWPGTVADRRQGEAETKLLEFSKDKEGFEVFVMRPSSVTPKERGVLKNFAAVLAPMIRVNELSAAMLDIAIHGGGGKQTFENGDLVSRGREASSRK
jgi:hypothetical protein